MTRASDEVVYDVEKRNHHDSSTILKKRFETFPDFFTGWKTTLLLFRPGIEGSGRIA